MFVDEVKIFVRSGRGGDGMVHFHREKFVPRGGPDGGDGGRGGDVIFEARHTLNTLVNFHYNERFIADSGARGGPNNMSGRGAKNLIIPVPPGTLIYDAGSGDLIGDLTEHGQQLVVARGGRGGRGNQHFASSSNQVPKMGEKGEPYEERSLRLELKLIADVGIVGMPNAGKSSLLAAVTNADPKVADYPFTTLEPNLGVAELDINNTLILADIPGLVEGAHRGVGLGDTFLRHIQRTRVLIHMIDGQSEDPIADLSQINSEMALYDEKLVSKPQIVVFNKIDMPEVAAAWPKLKKKLEKFGHPVMAISAMARTGTKELLWKTLELLQSAPQPVATETIPVYRPPEDPETYTIERTSDGWVVHSQALERAAAMTYWEYDAPVRRFQKLIEILGVDKALRKAGVQEGDSVIIGDYELEWQD
jgi:GTP-binding protein